MFGISLNDDTTLRLALGQAVIDKIVERTKSGELLSGSSSRGYSKEYMESEEFKAAGKSKKVNMTLTGDMLGLMDILDEGSNTITIGWNDSDENLKASNHLSGDTVPKRDFFGLTSSDVSEIKSKFQSDIDEVLSKRGSGREAAILSLIEKIGEDIGFNG